MATGFDVYILSNGTLIMQERAQRLADLGVHGVQVSLEGTEETHDGIRGAGSFAAALNGIRHLLGAGVKVSLNTTLSQMNVSNFPELVDLAVSLGVPRGLFPPGPFRPGYGHAGRRCSPPEQVKKFYEEIFAFQVTGLEITSGDPLASQMRAPPPGRMTAPSPGGCAAGVSGLTLLPDGTVTPCRRLPIPIGNVGRESLREIWATSPVLESPAETSATRGAAASVRDGPSAGAAGPSPMPTLNPRGSLTTWPLIPSVSSTLIDKDLSGGCHG